MSLSIQKTNLQKICEALAAGNAKIEALDTGLKPDVRIARIAAIRADVVQKIDGIRTDMITRQVQAKEGMTFWAQDAIRRRAKFSDDRRRMLRSAWRRLKF